MKEYYKIGEISKLYDIGTDSLRYYEEIGILKPRRDENGYRMYSVNDIRTLNVLRELRSIGFPMKDIKEHLSDYNLEKTVELFRKAVSEIENRQAELEKMKGQLSTRIHEIYYYIAEKNIHENISIRKLPERKILTISESIIRDADIDFVLKKLQTESEDLLYLIGNGEVGAMIDRAYLLDGGYGRFDSAFYIVEDYEEYDTLLPAGEYLCMTVKGSYENMKAEWEKLLEYAHRHELETTGDCIELYLIDSHDTNDESEFLTELQLFTKITQKYL